nr:hypothetical protein [Candidatus Njordarchaeota archaeon]
MDNNSGELLRKYSDLFVECSDTEVQNLYRLLSLFFAKCDGLLSSAEVQKLKGDLGSIPFDPYRTPVENKDSILVRLKFLKKYGISNPQEIIRVLTWGLFTTDEFDPSDRKYLVEFIENSDRPYNWFARKLNVSTASVIEAYNRLKQRIQFRFVSAINFPLFKLKHLLVFFKPTDEFESSMLIKPFTMSINRDTFGEWMWASFLVPDQGRSLEEFYGSLRRLAKGPFGDYGYYEVRSIGRSCNLSMFDGQRWIHGEDILGIGPLKMAERNKGALPRLNEFLYSEDSIKFDRVDFLISCLKYGDARLKTSEIKRILSQYGYSLSLVTLSKRLTSLRRARVFLPYYSFSGLGLNVASTFAVECDNELVETLYYAFPQFPECIASRTDKGVVFMLRTTAEASPAISYLVQSGLRDKASRLIVANRFENIGSKVPTGLYQHWNHQKHYWEFERGTFDLTKDLRR